MPAGLVRFMRERLKWDVLFVMEEDELRRAADIDPLPPGGQLRRTLVTLDRDYLDDTLFPCESGRRRGAERAARGAVPAAFGAADVVLFRNGSLLPLSGRKLHLHADWSGELA